MQAWEPGEQGIAPWVVEHNEPVLVEDELADPRVSHFRGVGAVDGSLIVVPLLGPRSAAGVLTLERLGRQAPFSLEEFDLVKLFAAQVSIALRNAEIFQAAEVRARTDNLTALLNHGTFKDQLARCVAEAEPFGLVMIDLDSFSTFNNLLGHQAGDRLLREIAHAIHAAARETDLVFRYGGDEFAVILPYKARHVRDATPGLTGTAGLAAIAERIQAAVAAVGGPGSAWAAESMTVGASIGTSSYPLDGITDEQILLAADRACFVAKRRGRGRVATAKEGLALAAEFTLSEPTPVDPPTIEA